MADDLNLVDMARKRFGEFRGELAKSKGAEPSPTDMNAAMYIQAGARVLLPLDKREGVAAPSARGNDPKPLQAAQNLAAAIINEKRLATNEERKTALTSMGLGVLQLEQAGYPESYTGPIRAFVEQQGGEMTTIPEMQSKLSPSSGMHMRQGQQHVAQANRGMALRV